MLHSEKWGKFSVFKFIDPGLYLLKHVVTARCCYRFAEDCSETKQELQCAQKACILLLIKRFTSRCKLPK